MDYLKVYRSIVERGQVREPDPDGYYEVHHIVPKCIKGDNSPENLTALTAREHYIAHWLLARIYPENRGICKAFFAMSVLRKKGREYKISGRSYEESRLSFSKYTKEYWEDPNNRKKQSERRKEYFKNPTNREKQSKISKNVWSNDNIRKNQSETIKKVWENNEKLTKQHSDIFKKMWEDPVYKENKIKSLSKLSEEQILEIRRLLGEGVSCSVISKKFNISIAAISNIKNGKTYKWVK